MPFSNLYITNVLDALTSSTARVEASRNVHLLKNALILNEFYKNYDIDRQIDVLLQRGLNGFDQYPVIARSYFLEVKKTVESNL